MFRHSFSVQLDLIYVPATLALVFLAALALQGCSGDFSDLPQQYREWSVYSGDPAGTKFSSLDQINRTNVGELKLAWLFRTGDVGEGASSTIECNPVIADGVLYATTPGLKVVALNATNGDRIWTFDAFAGKRARGVNRGVTLWGSGQEARLFFVAGSYLYALSLQDGRPLQGFGDAGRVDLRRALDRDTTGLSVTATSPGIVFNDLLIMGSAVGEGPAPAAPGHVRAYDARTGERRWIFHTIPHPGEFGFETWPPDAWLTSGGANAWGGFTLDERRGWVFFGTGSPSYDHYGGDRHGMNLFGNCIIALDATTGRRIWHFQVVHHDIWDYDLPCPPNLVTVVRDGRQVDAVAQPTKMGHLFLLDRETGVPLFPVEERAVPSSDVPGEKSWPTQPFPTQPPPYATQSFTENEVAEINPGSKLEILTRLKSMHHGALFLPPSLQGTVVLPQFNGGTDWGGAAFDPIERVLFVNASNEAEWISMISSQVPEEMSFSDLGRRIFGGNCSACHGDVEGSGPLGSASVTTLIEMVRTRTMAEISEVLAKGKGQMPAFSFLTEVERRALGIFLKEPENLESVGTKGEAFGTALLVPYVATGHNVFRDSTGLPVNRRPWGTLNAIDLNRGEIKWQVPLGTYPQIASLGLPPSGTFNMGGPLVTAGGLVFIGAAMDEKFRAFDKESGQLLWEFQLDAGGYATPMTYELDGTQYLVIAAGGGGKPETRSGDAYYCFALRP